MTRVKWLLAGANGRAWWGRRWRRPDRRRDAGATAVMRFPLGAVVFVLSLLIGVPAWPATYYVDAASGNDSNDALTQATAWKTISKVNGSTFVAGDQILFKRGCVWNERLTPPSSGTSGNPIVFDAYGGGEAPTLTGYVDAPAASWVQDSTNVWRLPITSPESFTYVLFGFVGSDGSVGGV